MMSEVVTKPWTETIVPPGDVVTKLSELAILVDVHDTPERVRGSAVGLGSSMLRYAMYPGTHSLK